MAFKPGEGGRPEGATNKTTKLVKEVFADVFAELQEHPTAKLKVWAIAEPTEFYKLASKLIPTQINADIQGELNNKLEIEIIKPLDDD